MNSLHLKCHFSENELLGKRCLHSSIAVRNQTCFHLWLLNCTWNSTAKNNRVIYARRTNMHSSINLKQMENICSSPALVYICPVISFSYATLIVYHCYTGHSCECLYNSVIFVNSCCIRVCIPLRDGHFCNSYNEATFLVLQGIVSTKT